MKLSAQTLVKEFINTYRQPLEPTLKLDVGSKGLRFNLIQEEYGELCAAQYNDNFIEVVDAWADLIYVLYGAGLTHGADLDAELMDRYGTTDLVEYFSSVALPSPKLDVPMRWIVQQEVAQSFDRYEYVFNHTEDIHLMVECWLDLIYVVYKAASLHGVDLDHVLEEVQASNMSKLDENGQPIFREEDGKVLKGPNFFPPNIRRVLEEQKA